MPNHSTTLWRHLKSPYLFAHLILIYFLYTGHLRIMEQNAWQKPRLSTLPPQGQATVPTDPWQLWVTYWPILQNGAIQYHSIQYHPPDLKLKGLALDQKALMHLQQQLNWHNINCQSKFEQKNPVTFSLNCQMSLTP